MMHKEDTGMAELLTRPDEVPGRTYKIKTPHSEHALYVTLNHIEENGMLRPVEVFLNSKCMTSFAWLVSLTRVVSAIFRQGGDVAFLIDEFKDVFDPQGGYYKRGGLFMPSAPAEFGFILEQYLFDIGTIKELSESGKAYAQASESLF